MSKRTKKVEAHLESTKDVHGNDIAILKIKDQSLGEIIKVDNNYEAKSNHGKEFKVHDVSEGLRDLLSEYHLHQGH